MKVGVVGLGSFGLFIARQLKPLGAVYGYSDEPVDIDGSVIKQVDSIEELITKVDVVFLAVPLNSYDVIVNAISKSGIDLSSTLIVDVASVKVHSQQILLDLLGETAQLLITHPLFGPESASGGLRGHTLVVTHSSGTMAERLLRLLKGTAGLNIERMTAEEHDRSMAYAHALTFVVGRALNGMDLEQLQITTPSFQKLLDVAAIDSRHSPQLFETIVQGNPYADQVLGEFIGKIQDLR